MIKQEFPFLAMVHLFENPCFSSLDKPKIRIFPSTSHFLNIDIFQIKFLVYTYITVFVYPVFVLLVSV